VYRIGATPLFNDPEGVCVLLSYSSEICNPVASSEELAGSNSKKQLKKYMNLK